MTTMDGEEPKNEPEQPEFDAIITELQSALREHTRRLRRALAAFPGSPIGGDAPCSN
jgi:hypothetical protein